MQLVGKQPDDTYRELTVTWPSTVGIFATSLVTNQPYPAAIDCTETMPPPLWLLQPKGYFTSLLTPDSQHGIVHKPTLYSNYSAPENIAVVPWTLNSLLPTAEPSTAASLLCKTSASQIPLSALHWKTKLKARIAHARQPLHLSTFTLACP